MPSIVTNANRSLNSVDLNSKNIISSHFNINKFEHELDVKQIHKNDILETDNFDSDRQIINEEETEIDRNENKIHTYFKRWVILFVFSGVSLLSAFNWIEYSIIQDVVIAFYNESLPNGEASQIDAVNWFSMVYMLCYIPLVFPAMFLLERKGLKLSIALGALLTFVGSAIKCAAVRPDLFGVAMLGQTICAIAQAFTLGVPARLSALWFGPNEIGLATSVSKIETLLAG